MSVITTPSTDHTDWAMNEPGPVKAACWPLSVPPTLTRSVSTPGVACSTDHGSRELGTRTSSSPLTILPQRVARGSIVAGLPWMTMTSVTFVTAGLSVTTTLVLRPTLTTRPGCSTVEKLSSSALIA